MVREDNQFIGKTIIYDYTINENPSDLIYSKAYQYDNTYKDRLISYGGTSIPYNTLACPTQLNAYNLTWTKGKLTSVYKGSLLTGTERYNYTYNAYGQRLTKVYNKTEGRNPITPIISGDVVSFNKNYKYDHSGRLINETNTINYYQEGSLTQTIDYLYDGNLIIGIKYNNGYSINTYFFERNILGDVVGIYDTDGNLKVRYLYDAYGNCTISSETIDQALARVNPIRYRGYYYDVETQLFYCNSRYYSPELCRFISPDSIEYLDPQSINGLNLYCYCYNNPIMYADPSGHSAILIGLIIGAIVGATIGFGTAAYIDYQDDGQIFNGSVAWYDYLGAIILGGAAGAAIGAGIGYIAPQIGSALSSFASTSFTFGGGISLSTGGAATMTAGLTITGAQVLTVAGTLTLAGSLMLMAKDPFIRHLEQGMTEHQKEMFQREIEGLKGNTGRKGNDNLDKNTLRKIADFIKSMFK